MFGKEAGSFANPGGFVDKGESSIDGAVRETMEETGYYFDFTSDDLEKYFDNPTTPSPAFIELTNETDHETMRGSEVSYKLYFKQVRKVTAAELLEAARNGRKLHGGGETIAFALVPIQSIYNSVAHFQPIYIDTTNPEVFAHDPAYKTIPIPQTQKYEIKLFSSFIQLLKTHEESKSSKSQIGWLRWLKGKPMERDLLHKKKIMSDLKDQDHFKESRKENERPRDTEIAIKEGTDEQYNLIKDEDGTEKLVHRERKALSPENLPFTATGAHLRLLMATLENNHDYLNFNKIDVDAVINQFIAKYAMAGIPTNKDNEIEYIQEKKRQLRVFDEIDENTKDQIKRVVQTEMNNRKDYVLYHALNQINAFFQDVLTILRAELSGNPNGVNFSGVWDDGFLQQDIHTLQHLFEHAEKANKVYDYDTYKNIMLSTNPALFSNNNNTLEYSLRYWLTDFSNTPRGGLEALKNAFASLGIPEKSVERLINLYKELKDKKLVPSHGRLLQIFIDPAIIDKVAYVADGNRPLEKAFSKRDRNLSRPSKVLYKLRENPISFENDFLIDAELIQGNNDPRPKTNFLQVRLLPFTDVTSKNFNVNMYIYDHYDHRSEHEKQMYFLKLQAFIKEELLPAYKQGLKDFRFKGDLDQPVAMLKFEQENPDQVKRRPKASNIKSWVDNSDVSELVKFIDSNPNNIKEIIDTTHSAWGVSHTSLIDYIFQKEKWGLLCDVLEKLTPNQKIEFTNTNDAAYRLAKIFEEKIFFRVVNVLLNHYVDKNFFKELMSYLLSNTNQNHDHVRIAKRQRTFEILDYFISDNIVNLDDIAFEAANQRSVQLATVNWLAEKHHFAFFGFIINNIFSNSTLNTIMPSSQKILSDESTMVWHQDLKKFLNYCLEFIEKADVDLLEVNSYRGDEPTPEALGYMISFYKQLDSEKTPDLKASIGNYIKMWSADEYSIESSPTN